MIKVLKNRQDLNSFRRNLGDKTVSFVPTMGNLHDGHLLLMRRAKEIADIAIASIYVNPTQFGENEDLDTYPRTFAADLAKLESLGVDAVFYPSDSIIYPHGKDDNITIQPPEYLSNILCALNRPTHFQGVATVVAKLFQLVKPDIAVFGEKDYQQLAIIRHLNKALFFDIDIVGVGIVREPSGLAMSSRNQYLSEDERERANWLSKTLNNCYERLYLKESINAVLTQGKAMLREHGVDVEYLDYRDRKTLQPHSSLDTLNINESVLLVAGHVGGTRLIDNLQAIIFINK